MNRLVAYLGLTLLLAGCAPQDAEPAKLKVGTVDVMRIMEERPETKQIRLEWSSQAGETYLEIAAVQDEAEALALQKEIEKRSAAWQKRMDEFVGDSIEIIEQEASTIAKQKDLDIVLVDNTLTKTSRYSEGEDLTLDISLELQNK